MEKVQVKQARTKAELRQAYAIRRAVFIEEQKIAENEEWDGLDDTALHFIALDGKQVTGTARVRLLSPESAKIERMAVLKPFRRKGVGKSIIGFVEKYLTARDIRDVFLHAQVTAIPFYHACGYEESI